MLREFGVKHFEVTDDPNLETDPTRELEEEFFEALKINLQPGHYVSKPVATIVENDPAPTDNIHAEGLPILRVYRVFEASITDSALADAIMKNSESLSRERICKLALKDTRNGGKGPANAMLVLPSKHLTENYLSMPPEECNAPILYEKHRFEETVPAMPEDITAPKYQKL